MAIRPVDLQQIAIRTPDITHDTAAQQQAGLVQQGHAAEQTKRQAQQAETVQQFDEAGAVLIRERDARGGQQGAQQDGAKQQSQPEEEPGTAKEATPARLGRHIDLSA